MINEWPESQICMDCIHAGWLNADENKPILYPAAVCEKNCCPIGDSCPQRVDLCDTNTVDLIASGYEWICPGFQQLNNEIEITAKVSCKGYERIFSVKDSEHAYG
jgi:hypothetical protein